MPKRASVLNVMIEVQFKEMMHLIGLAHRAQARCQSEKTDAQRAFETLLRRTIEVVGPTFIAEEESEEALLNRHEVSIAKEVADEKGIEHRFCDPTQEERVAIGYMDCRAIWQQRMGEMLPGNELDMKAQAIEIACYFPIREQFWLEKLDGCRNESVIFVCGDGHIETFCKLLERESIEHEVVKRGIGRDGRDDEFYRAVQYLKEHPELSECAG